MQKLYMWGQEVCGKSVPSTQLCYEPKTALKNKVCLNKEEKKTLKMTKGRVHTSKIVEYKALNPHSPMQILT